MRRTTPFSRTMSGSFGTVIDGDAAGAQEARDGREDGGGIDGVLEDLGADDAIEARGGQVELVDLALEEAGVVAREVLAGGVEEDVGDVDRREARAAGTCAARARRRSRPPRGRARARRRACRG